MKTTKTYRFDAETLKLIERYCKKYNCTATEVIRIAVKNNKDWSKIKDRFQVFKERFDKSSFVKQIKEIDDNESG